MKKMEVVCVSKKLIKPCTPTPQNLRKYRISSMDELNPTMNTIIILYYPSVPDFTQKLDHLEESMAKVLPQFYPFAGRYVKEHHLVDCSDQGALLAVAEAAHTDLHQIAEVEVDQLNDLSPLEIGEADEENDPILAVQVTRFRCGGVSVAVCISHRLVDACGLGTFIAAWRNACGPSTKLGEVVSPSFDGPQVLPGRGFPAPEFGTSRTRQNRLYNLAPKKYAFNKNSISRMREAVAGPQGPLFSRVQLVCGLIVNAIAGIDRARNGRSRGMLIVQAVNMRERTVPPLPKHSCGNLAALSITELSSDEVAAMGFADFTGVLRRDVLRTVEECRTALSEAGRRQLLQTSKLSSEKSLSEDVVVVWATDWSKFGFYEADLGWGKPEWTSVAGVGIKNHVLMLGNKEGGGIEVWVELQHDDVDFFNGDEQLKSFVARS